ncbi:MAG: hypothetical protein A2Y17_07505 [Clostridiales bacterium GWF2_38_85]|nr:MAG: hypothetical protein A2Y17_07505 [Clostridiales bacterium GWF2_38_85]
MDKSIDLVFSNYGYESMQAKMMEGFREAYRVLKDGGCSVYTKSVIESHESSNSKKWMNLLLSSVEKDEAEWWKEEFIDVSQWIDKCKAIKYFENTYTKIYGELPAPDTNTFPFLNEMAQWMAEYIFTSTK